METNDSTLHPNENSSNHDALSHALDIIKAAFPHLDSNSQQTIDLFIKTGELIETISKKKNSDHVTSFGLSKPNIDIEALLTSIRTVCYEKEREFVDMVLNFIKAKNLFDTYSMISSMASNSENSSNQNGSNMFNNSFLGGLNFDNNPNMQELLESMLTPEQKNTFDNISMMLNLMHQ